jgi:outer membrane protein TolC
MITSIDRTGWAPAVALLLTALLAVPAHADGDPLRGIVDEALAHNLSVAGARQDARAAQAKLDAARMRWLPSASLETRASRLHDVPDLGSLVNPAYAALDELTGTAAFPTDVKLTLPQPFESHARVVQPIVSVPLLAGASMASAGRDAGRLAWAATARAVAAQAQAAWLQQASARRLADVYASTQVLVEENERTAERLLAAGAATPEAVHRARADRAEVEQALAEAREQAAAAAREFDRVIGRPLDAAPEVLDDSLFAVAPPVSPDEAVASALAHREELALGDARVRAADAAECLADAAFLPSLAAVVDVGWQGRTSGLHRDDRSWTASLVATWDLFHGGSDLAEHSAARAAATRARLDRRDAADRVAVEARNAAEAARVAYEAIATAQVRVDAARRTYALVHRRWEEGSASPLELTDARTQRTTAESNQVLTLYRYALRRVDLERAAALRVLPAPMTKGAPR